MIKFLVPFLEAFFIAIISGFVLMRLAKKIKWKERISKRHIHSPGARRVGGIVVILAYLGAIFFNKDLVITPEIWGVLGVSVFVVLMGIIDDIKEIIWKMQLFSQILAAVFVFIIGIRIYYVTNPLTGGIINLDSGLGVIISSLLVIIWLVLVMNSLNWIDGVDGLSGGITFISSLTILFLSLRGEVNQPPIAILASALAGASLGFLIFNFNPSRMLSGTSGSMFMGLTLAVLAIISGTKIATASLVLAIPIVDFLWVIGRRMRQRSSIFKPDMSHLHYRLMESGWSQKKIALSFYLITALIAIVALNTRAIGKLITIIIAFVIMAVASQLIDKKDSSQSDL
jgi:UDP-GlcNAc:undecaprenyl-phosphate/decaprenyl-phosphate GlcNAc-1-phosphate transferase